MLLQKHECTVIGKQDALHLCESGTDFVDTPRHLRVQMQMLEGVSFQRQLEGATAILHDSQRCGGESESDPCRLHHCIRAACIPHRCRQMLSGPSLRQQLAHDRCCVRCETTRVHLPPGAAIRMTLGTSKTEMFRSSIRHLRILR